MKAEGRRQEWIWALIALVLMTVQTGGRAQQQQPPRKATDTEALAGSAVRAFVTPDQVAAVLAAGGAGGPTNGQNAAQVLQNIQSNAVLQASGKGTNNGFVTPALTNPTNSYVGALIGTVNFATQDVFTASLGSTNVGRMFIGSIGHLPELVGSGFAVDDTFGMAFYGLDDWGAGHGKSNLLFAVTGYGDGYFENGLILGGNGNQSMLRIDTRSFAPDVHITNMQGGKIIFDTGPTGSGASLTNLIGNAVLPGANINVAAAKRPNDGGTNYTPSVADPIVLNQGNFGSITLTNIYTATNNQTGITLIDLAAGAESTLLLAGDITFTGFSNAVAGVYNEKIVHILPNGANRVVTVPASWKLGRYNTGVVTNATCGDFLFSMQAGEFTNWFQLDAK